MSNTAFSSATNSCPPWISRRPERSPSPRPPKMPGPGLLSSVRGGAASIPMTGWRTFSYAPTFTTPTGSCLNGSRSPSVLRFDSPPEVALKVVALEPERALVLRGSVPMGNVAPPYEFTWAFVMLPQPDGTTRFMVRERYRYTRRWAALIVQPAQLVSCLMTPKMLRGIKSRAEHTPTNGIVRQPPRPPTTDRTVPAEALPTIRPGRTTAEHSAPTTTADPEGLLR